MSTNVVNENAVNVKPRIISVEVLSDKRKYKIIKSRNESKGKSECEKSNEKKEKSDENVKKKKDVGKLRKTKIVEAKKSSAMFEDYQCPSMMTASYAGYKTDKTDRFDTKFAKPEYNSIKWTIQKMRQVENEVLVKNLKSLPVSVKKNIDKKISASLNCSPSDTVFKDLVNLSVNDIELVPPKSRKPISKSSSLYTIARQCSVPRLNLDGISDAAGTTSSSQNMYYY